MAFYDYKCPRCKTVFEITKGMTEKYSGGCPKCDKWWWPFKRDVKQVLYSAPVIWDENQNPGGVQTLLKRHEKGLWWDSPSAKKESEELKKQGKEDGYKWAKKMAEHDEKEMAGKYKPVSEKEALDILKDPNRKQEVHIVQKPTKDEFGLK